MFPAISSHSMFLLTTTPAVKPETPNNRLDVVVESTSVAPFITRISLRLLLASAQVMLMLPLLAALKS